MSIKVFSLCAILMLESPSSKNGNIFRRVLTCTCLHYVRVCTTQGFMNTVVPLAHVLGHTRFLSFSAVCHHKPLVL